MSPAKSKGFRHVLCPVDFSKQSAVALRYAAEIAARYGASLTTLVANDAMLVAAAAAATRDPRHLTDTTTAELRKFITRTLGTAAQTATLEVVAGDPGPEIERGARRIGADLVVMGTHGLRGPRKWFFGLTTQYVLRHATVPLLAVPARARGHRHDLRRFPGKTALVPIDLDGSERSDVRVTIRAAAVLGVEPLLLHVVSPLQLPPWIGSELEPLERQRVESASTRLADVARSAGGRYTYRVVVGDPAEEIMRAAEKSKVGLIILRLKRGNLLQPQQGSLTYRILSSGVGPVLALP